MTNAELFRTIFNGAMATEVWAMPETEFLEWVNSEASYCLDDCDTKKEKQPHNN